MKNKLNIISYGGGIQTFALLILNARGEISPKAEYIIFADTGSERQDTMRHIYQWAEPYAEEQGFEFYIVQSHLGPLHATISKGKIPVPFYGSRGGQVQRRCTERWKIRIVRKKMRQLGAKRANVQLGISWDEVHRMKASDLKWTTNTFPLIDLKLTRDDCVKIIEDSGMEVPIRSACWHCPYRSINEWREMKDKFPHEFFRAKIMESKLDGLYLHWDREPIEEVIRSEDESINDMCGGYCWT